MCVSGGEPSASEAVFHELMRIRRSGKPVVVSLCDRATGAAYQVAGNCLCFSSHFVLTCLPLSLQSSKLTFNPFPILPAPPCQSFFPSFSFSHLCLLRCRAPVHCLLSLVEKQVDIAHDDRCLHALRPHGCYRVMHTSEHCSNAGFSWSWQLRFPCCWSDR